MIAEARENCIRCAGSKQKSAACTKRGCTLFSFRVGADKAQESRKSRIKKDFGPVRWIELTWPEEQG
jgi:hypothetical protein